MITELRKELRVSDDEHRELLTRVNADEIIHRIRYYSYLSSFSDAAKIYINNFSASFFLQCYQRVETDWLLPTFQA